MSATEKSLRVAVVKRDFVTSGLPTFAGGKHAFRCLARSLSKAGFVVTVLCEATPAQVMLSFVTEGSTTSGQSSIKNVPERVCPGAIRLSSLGCTVIACETTCDAGDSVIGEALRQARPDIVLIDSDDLYVEDGGNAVGAGKRVFPSVVCSGSDAPVMVLVQNVHFLPFGPAGCCAPSEEGVLEVWRSAAGVACVSRFVADYVTRWCRGGLRPDAFILTVSLNAFGVFGDGPFPDIGGRVACRMDDALKGLHHGMCIFRDDAQSRPVVVMPKLSDVKGAKIFFSLAARFPEVSFVGVTGDAHTSERGALETRYPSNVTLREPGDIDSVLEGAWVMLCPSLWLEAFGMVVVDGLARGIPVLASSVGGLREAKLGTGYSIAVQPIQFRGPSGEAVSCTHEAEQVHAGAAEATRVQEEARGSGRGAQAQPNWGDRVLPEQDMAPWEAALRELLDIDIYTEESRSSRSRAARYIDEGGDALRSFCAQLRQLHRKHAPPSPVEGIPPT